MPRVLSGLLKAKARRKKRQPDEVARAKLLLASRALDLRKWRDRMDAEIRIQELHLKYVSPKHIESDRTDDLRARLRSVRRAIARWVCLACGHLNDGPFSEGNSKCGNCRYVARLGQHVA